MRRLTLAFAAALSLWCGVPAHAADTPNPKNGLFITPVREYITTGAKETSAHTLTVANLTNKPMAITLSVEKFQVSDFSYDYKFEETSEQWVTFVEDKLTLNPNQNQSVAYTVTPPPNAAPGGHYLTILATATLDNGAVKTNLQAATLLYITINGNLNRSSTLKADQLPVIQFGGDLRFSLTVQSTANTHFFIFLYGQLFGPSAKPKNTEVAHLLMPGTTRQFDGTIPGPLLPGVYKATIGYTSEGGEQERERWIIYIPPWSLIVLAGLILLVVVTVRLIRRRRGVKTIGI